MLRGAIVGYGFIMEKGHAAAYRQRAEELRDVEIVAVADVSEARRELARRHFPGARVYDSHEALLAAEQGNLDFVDVATPPADHAAVAHAALDRGLHVLCEKPLATTTDEARGMLRHARRAGRVLYPCHNYKHAPVIKSVRRVLDAGRIGRVHLVTLQTFRNTHAKGVADWRPDWRRERRHSGGGIAMDHGSHTFYLAFEWLRAYPTAITGRVSTSGPYDTEDDFTCTLRFPTGVASAHLSWNAGVRKVLYTIHGERGAVRVEDDDIEVATLEKASGQTAWKFEREAVASDWMDSSHVSWFNSLFDEFRGAIARGELVGKDAQESLLCVELITTAYESARDASRELPLAGLAALDDEATADEAPRGKRRERRLKSVSP
jgi:predicted dehydrogenase